MLNPPPLLCIIWLLYWLPNYRRQIICNNNGHGIAQGLFSHASIPHESRVYRHHLLLSNLPGTVCRLRLQACSKTWPATTTRRSTYPVSYWPRRRSSAIPWRGWNDGKTTGSCDAAAFEGRRRNLNRENKNPKKQKKKTKRISYLPFLTADRYRCYDDPTRPPYPVAVRQYMCIGVAES